MTHPTRDSLISTVSDLLETTDPHLITVEEVLEKSKVSTGSMYHHFADLSDLIDHAMLASYSADIDESLDTLVRIVDTSSDSTSLASGLRRLTTRTFAPDRFGKRLLRAQVMSRAATNPKFREALQAHQRRLTDAIADLVRALQDKGLFSSDIDPMAASTFIQAYSMGLLVNDVVARPVKHSALVGLTMAMYQQLFFAH